MTVAESFKGTTLRLLRAKDEDTLFDALNGLLYATAQTLNVKQENKLNNFQAFDLIHTLINDYADIKLEEMILIFKQGKKGTYGPHYNKLDIETVMGWINGYFKSDEYNNYLENRHKQPLEKVELSQEQKDNWKTTLANIEAMKKEADKKRWTAFQEKTPTEKRELKQVYKTAKIQRDYFKSKFVEQVKTLSIKDLKTLLTDYSTMPDHVSIIENELNTRTNEKRDS